jgi:hypothetical protein
MIGSAADAGAVAREPITATALAQDHADSEKIAERWRLVMCLFRFRADDSMTGGHELCLDDWCARAGRIYERLPSSKNRSPLLAKHAGESYRPSTPGALMARVRLRRYVGATGARVETRREGSSRHKPRR